ncbi:hypothetical protein IE4771_PE00096 (plasmid) [Rhizobium etli bv. mimosae str. IE4771]|uniref:Uncharacterized protein n=2 Tax=Rhizobium etli TaxID=29449 RepID=A0A060IC46_RHIET|nr:hypothetical protein IE4771_PE00096 [Rhizobium sp. IE4771]
MNTNLWLRALRAVVALIPLCLGIAGTAWAADDAAQALGLSNEVYTASAKALTMLFVTAVVLESAFAVIFNWRVFLAYFDTRGLKTIVMIVISTIVVFYFKLDIFASLLAAYSVPNAIADPAGLAASLQAEVKDTSGTVSKLVTALVLAGGSSGVHNMMYALGFRNNRDTDTISKPDLNEAWVSVSVTRRTVDGPVLVTVQKVDAAPDGAAVTALAGSVRFRRPAVKELLMRNINRFPQNGGYVVEPDKTYLIQAIADKRGDTSTQLSSPTRYYRFAPRAIVDLDIVL